MKIEFTYDNGLAEMAQRIEESISEIIAAGADVVCESAKSMCPVDTGALKSSINVNTLGNTAEISANTDYAAYVEFGTSKMVAQPYLVPSLIGGANAAVSAIVNAIDGVC